MPVVQLYGGLRRGMDTHKLVVPGETVRSMLDDLCVAHPHLRAALFEQDHLRPYVRVMVNGHDVELAQGLDTRVASDDRVAIFPPIAGGAA
jgi:sulfur-carrier protein